jgi:CubicO group peptidase (beta-lactamase class C family)
VNDPRFRYVYRRIPADGFAGPAPIVAFVKHARLDFRPGTSAAYSNTGFEVLGMIVEKVTGQPLRDVLQEQIFGPLHMESASLSQGGLPGHPLIHGYTQDHVVSRDVTTPQLPAYAAGYVAMDGPDLAYFLDALFAGHVVPEAQLTMMRTLRSRVLAATGGNDYGYGLSRQHLRCGDAFGHSGRLPGYDTEAWVLPRRHRTLVAFGNRADSPGSQVAPLGSLIEEALCG